MSRIEERVQTLLEEIDTLQKQTHEQNVEFTIVLGTAAKNLERLATRVVDLEDALRPFAALRHDYMDYQMRQSDPCFAIQDSVVTFRDLLTAKELLEHKEILEEVHVKI